MPRSPHPRSRWSFAALVLVGALATSSAGAQSAAASPSDSLPFRAGQWGAEFGLGSYTSVGFLRFRSPSRAWVGTVAGDYTRQSPDGDVPDRTSSRFDLTAGHRWFRAVLPDVSQFVSLGGVVGLQRFETGLPSSGFPDQGPILTTSSRSSAFAGLVADVGAQWMVTPSLALGAKWGAQAVVGRERERLSSGSSASTELTGTSLSLFVGRIAILGTLYF